MQLNIRISAETRRQLDELQQRLGESEGRVITRLIEREYQRRDTMSETERRWKLAAELAVKLHDEVCGCDDKTCTIASEMRDWMVDGDLELMAAAPLPTLVAEWREYYQTAEA